MGGDGGAIPPAAAERPADAGGAPPAPDVPPSVRAIRRARDLLHRRRRALLAAAVLAAGALWLARGAYTVDTAETAAVLRFGRLLDDAVGPGLHAALPGGIDRVVKAPTGEVARLELDGGGIALVTGDTNLIEAGAVVQVRIGRLGPYLFATEDPEALVRLAVRAALVEALGGTRVDEVLTSAKAGVQTQVRTGAQERLDAWGAGVVVVAVNLQAIEPPAEAAGAFRDVADARAGAAEAVSRAEGERGRALRLARGEAEQILEQARAAADRRVQEARGAADRFQALLAQHRQSPGLARVDLYRATVRQVLPRTRLIVLPPGGAPRVDVHLLEGAAGEGYGAPLAFPPGEGEDR
jgi:membrane protease subunit HflK